MLTRKGKYGLKAMLALVREHGQGPVLIGELAEQERIPKKFLETILLELKHRGLVQSRKGPHGGYQLGRTPERISVGEVIRALDGPLALVSCVSQTAYAPCEECVTERDCAVRRIFQQVRDETARILDGTTLAAAAGAGPHDDEPGRQNLIQLGGGR
jgi:Rrf2 family protein